MRVTGTIPRHEVTACGWRDEGHPREVVGVGCCALDIDRDPGSKSNFYIILLCSKPVDPGEARTFTTSPSLPYHRTDKGAYGCAFPQFPCTSPMHVDLMKRSCKDEVEMLPTSPWKVCLLPSLYATSLSLMRLFDTEIAFRRCDQMKCSQQHNTDSSHQGVQVCAGKTLTHDYDMG